MPSSRNRRRRACHNVLVGWIFVMLVMISGLGAELLARQNFYLQARAPELL
jgi:hypothetical protein